jgi:hypothetical protein
MTHERGRNSMEYLAAFAAFDGFAFEASTHQPRSVDLPKAANVPFGGSGRTGTSVSRSSAAEARRRNFAFSTVLGLFRVRCNGFF